MLSNLFGKFLKQEGQEQIIAPKDINATFELKYKDLLIGKLKLIDGEWLFEYDKGFDKQNKVQKLIDFPDIYKQYKSKELWPFFSSRIPGLGQPKVKAIIKHKNLDEHDELQLLKVFGLKTLTNPFQLELV